MLNKIISISYVVLVICISLISCSDNNKSKSSVLSGPYFGQTPPGMTPELFAPGIVSTQEHEHSIPSFSPDGKEVYWTTIFKTVNIRFPSLILRSRMTNGVWSEPVIAEFSGKYPVGGGSLSPDGKKFFFSCVRPDINDLPTDEPRTDMELWYVERTDTGWNEPQKLKSGINTVKNEMQPTIASNGNLYYVGYFEGGRNNLGIFKSEFKNGEYQKPVLLNSKINSPNQQWTPYIAPDESYLLFSLVSDGGYGSGDIYISFKDQDGEFGEPINIGPEINTENNERFPYISPDGKYLFFLTDKPLHSNDPDNPKSLKELYEIRNNPGNGFCDFYWVSAKVIDDIKLKNIK